MTFQGKNTGVDSHILLQGRFQTHGSNPDFLHYRRVLYCLSHQETHCESRYHRCCIHSSSLTHCPVHFGWGIRNPGELLLLHYCKTETTLSSLQFPYRHWERFSIKSVPVASCSHWKVQEMYNLRNKSIADRKWNGERVLLCLEMASCGLYSLDPFDRLSPHEYDTQGVGEKTVGAYTQFDSSNVKGTK